jgi:hypothetical protein
MGWLTNLCARRFSLWPTSRRVAIERGLLLFTALSVADLSLTWLLLERARGCACESNPVASWWLAHFGLPGLAGFKGGIVLLVAALVLFVARHRPGAARRVLVFGCSILLGVVLYSGVLVYRVEADVPALGRAEETHRNLDRKAVRLRAYLALRDRLRDDLVARRCTLAEAVERLAAAEHVQDSGWRQMTSWRRSDWTLRECLADHLVNYALLPREAGAPAPEQFAQELNAQLQSCFSGGCRPNRISGHESASLLEFEPISAKTERHEDERHLSGPSP